MPEPIVIGASERAAFERAIAENGVPADQVRVLDADISEDGDAALALALINAGGDPYPMISFLEAYDGEWSDLVLTEADGAGANWAAERWVSYVSGEAPAGASVVVVEQDGHAKRRPVAEGRYVAAFWRPRGGPEDAPPEPPVVVRFD